ncbi:MAG: restriction endonuclease, SacI family [Phycisphaerales bacterium]|nr:restriction endonuclease, SacI family [Phycisphaerales bacterium]
MNVDHDAAKAALHAALKLVDDRRISVDPKIQAALASVMAGTEVTYKYILVTGILGKYVNSSIHPRVLQAGSSLPGAYDARSLCHKVVVPFEKSVGNLWGLSNEPFLNKPARHPEHDKDNPQLRAKQTAAVTHALLELAHKAPREKLLAILTEILRIGKSQIAQNAVAQVSTGAVTIARIEEFVGTFLQQADGGARLSAVVYAYMSLLNPDFTVKVYSPNVSDKFAETAGDVEIREKSSILSAVECKHRPINIDDVRHGLRKAREKSLLEYIFVLAAGEAAGQKSEILNELTGAAAKLDVSYLTIDQVVKCWTPAINPRRRVHFGERVIDALRAMRRDDLARTAADLWNESE